MTKKEIFSPIGPFGSILIGIALGVAAFLWEPMLMWLAVAFFFGGFIMLTTRMIQSNKSLMDKS
ncbi:MAG: hypothetical protein AAGC72_16245 [Planctomycetota bacterium]